MYEDSQRFSDEEGEESSHVVSFHPRLTMGNVTSQIENLVGGTVQYHPSIMMQHEIEENPSSLLLGADALIGTPEYGEFRTNVREESLQRILARMSPNGRQAYLRTLSEGDSEIRPPRPFFVPETDEECSSDEGEREDRHTHVDYLMDCPITELTTKPLIPPPNNMVSHSKNNDKGSSKCHSAYF